MCRRVAVVGEGCGRAHQKHFGGNPRFRWSQRRRGHFCGGGANHGPCKHHQRHVKSQSSRSRHESCHLVSEKRPGASAWKLSCCDPTRRAATLHGHRQTCCCPSLSAPAIPVEPRPPSSLPRPRPSLPHTPSSLPHPPGRANHLCPLYRIWQGRHSRHPRIGPGM